MQEFCKSLGFKEKKESNFCLPCSPGFLRVSVSPWQISIFVSNQSINLPMLPKRGLNLSLSHDQYLMNASPLILSRDTKPQKRLS